MIRSLLRTPSLQCQSRQSTCLRGHAGAPGLHARLQNPSCSTKCCMLESTESATCRCCCACAQAPWPVLCSQHHMDRKVPWYTICGRPSCAHAQQRRQTFGRSTGRMPGRSVVHRVEAAPSAALLCGGRKPSGRAWGVRGRGPWVLGSGTLVPSALHRGGMRLSLSGHGLRVGGPLVFRSRGAHSSGPALQRRTSGSRAWAARPGGPAAAGCAAPQPCPRLATAPRPSLGRARSGRTASAASSMLFTIGLS